MARESARGSERRPASRAAASVEGRTRRAVARRGLGARRLAGLPRGLAPRPVPARGAHRRAGRPRSRVCRVDRALLEPRDEHPVPGHRERATPESAHPHDRERSRPRSRLARGGADRAARTAAPRSQGKRSQLGRRGQPPGGTRRPRDDPRRARAVRGRRRREPRGALTARAVRGDRPLSGAEAP